MQMQVSTEGNEEYEGKANSDSVLLRFLRSLLLKIAFCILHFLSSALSVFSCSKFPCLRVGLIKTDYFRSARILSATLRSSRVKGCSGWRLTKMLELARRTISELSGRIAATGAL